MTRNTLLASTLVGVLVITGCMSLEERLASNDPTIKRNAEYELVANSRRTGTEADRIAAIKRVTNADLLMEIALTAHPEQKKKYGTVSSTIPDGMAALEKLTDQKSLSKLATKADAEEIRLAALDKVSDQGILLELCKACADDALRNKILLKCWRQISDQKILAAYYKDAYDKLSDNDRKELVSKLTDQKVLKRMVVKPDYDELQEKKNEIIHKYYKGPLCDGVQPYYLLPQRDQFVSNDGHCNIDELKIVLARNLRDRATSKKLEDRVIQVESMIQREFKQIAESYVTNDVARQALYPQLAESTIIKIVKNSQITGEDRQILVKKLSDDQIVKMAIDPLKVYDEYAWSSHKMQILKQAIKFASYVREERSTLKILAKVLTKIDSVRRACLSHTLGSWDSDDIEQAKQLVERFPKVSDAAYGDLVCLDGNGWKYLLKKITPAVAYGILTQGKAKSEELETELAKMLPAEKIDMKVYEAVRYDAAKKVVMSKMSAAMKKSIAEKNVKAFAVVEEKAKVAAKDTFELHGFYLGMDWEDMKTVLAHHFPDLEIKEMRDGKSNDDDFIIDLPNQRSPFCYASAKDKKVYKFNFGKKMLKKWYPYDVQTFREWAHAYSRENKIDMKYKEIEKEATVTEPMDWSRSYRVWFHQESYQYKHNTKEYRLTYFGEEKDFTVHGGLGGALIKEAAAPQFRYVRGDPGSLRATIEND